MMNNKPIDWESAKFYKGFDVCYYRDNGPSPDADYLTLEQAIQEEREKGIDVEIDFYKSYSFFQYYPKTDDNPSYWNNLIIILGNYQFVYICQRNGIVNADYQITLYMKEHGKIVKRTYDEVAHALWNATRGEVKWKLNQ